MTAETTTLETEVNRMARLTPEELEILNTLYEHPVKGWIPFGQFTPDEARRYVMPALQRKQDAVEELKQEFLQNTKQEAVEGLIRKFLQLSEPEGRA